MMAMRGFSRALVALLVVQAACSAAAGTAAAKSTPQECIQKLSDAASRCSSCLNRANKVAYQRLDRLFVSRSNIRLDVGRFFHLAVGFSQDTVKAPESCCAAAAEVFSARFQSECACLPEVVAHTKFFDKELFDYYFDFLSSSCPLEGAQAWQTCGLVGGMFITKVTEAAHVIPELMQGAASAAGGVLGGVAGSVADVASRVPFAGHRRMQEGAPAGGEGAGQCGTRGFASRVALNNASAPFYFLCPAGKGHCDAGTCVYGRTPAVNKGEWATCQSLTNCGDGAAAVAAPPGGDSGCFPAAATVRVAGGRAARMDELRIGDKVLALGAGGALEYQDVYFFGHRDSDTEAEFVRLELSGGAALELTPDHFVPVVAARDLAGGGLAAAAGRARMTYARDVRAGDVMLVAAAAEEEAEGEGAGGLRAAEVLAARRVRRRGMFNPYTLGGSIVVDGVLASAHSSWLVDGPLAAAGAAHRVPALLQALFAPLRALYRLAGPEAMEVAGSALAAAGLRLEAALLSRGAAAAAAAPAVAAATAAAAAAATAVLKRRLRAAA